MAGQPGSVSEEQSLRELFTAPRPKEQFACPVPGCGGKLSISPDLCRFGHGAHASCQVKDDTGARSHKSQWCNVSYRFIPCESWGEHLSYCWGPEQSRAHTIDAANLRGYLAEHAVGSSPDDQAVSGNASAAEEDDDGTLEAQIAEGFDREIVEIVGREVKRHRKSIECGEPEHTRWWSDRLRELQRQTVISALQAHASFPKATGSVELEPEEMQRAAEGGLFQSVAAGDVAAVRSMMQRPDVDLGLQDGCCNSPLHWAAATGCVATCRALVDSGIDVRAAGDDGHTALHLAAMHGRHGVVQLLVARGGDMDQENDSGLTPRHLVNIFAMSAAADASRSD